MHLVGEAAIRAADFLLLLVAHLEQVALAVFRIGRRYLLTGSLGIQPGDIFLDLLARIAERSGEWSSFRCRTCALSFSWAPEVCAIQPL